MNYFRLFWNPSGALINIVFIVVGIQKKLKNLNWIKLRNMCKNIIEWQIEF